MSSNSSGLTEDKERLSVLLKHWIEDQREHVKKYQEWADKMEGHKQYSTSSWLRQATRLILQANGMFLAAMEELNLKD